MKNHYDKIFLALAFLVMLASCAFFFLGKSKLDTFKAKTVSLRAQGAQGEMWETKEVNTKVSKSMAWRYPDFQDEKGDWLFQVFTPPRIWQDDNGQFITQAPKMELILEEEEEEITEATCDLYLAKITSGAYPIALLGYIGSNTNPIFQFKDSRDPSNPIEFTGKNGESLAYKDPKDMTGKTMIELGLKIVSFKKERIKYADNTMRDIMFIELEDENLGKKVELRSDKATIIEDEKKMILASEIDSRKKWTISAKGEEIDYNGSVYTVSDISFKDKKIILNQKPKSPNFLPSVVDLRLRKEAVEEESSEEGSEESSIDSSSKTSIRSSSGGSKSATSSSLEGISVEDLDAMFGTPSGSSF